jgi:hypothetical protein
MPKQKKDIKKIYSFQLINIELLGQYLSVPEDFKPVAGYGYKVQIETKLDLEKKLVINILSIDIAADGIQEPIAGLTGSFWFTITDFDEVTKQEGKLKLPDVLSTTLNSLSISTARGMLFTTFSGTVLQKAIMPLIDPSKPEPDQKQP